MSDHRLHLPTRSNLLHLPAVKKNQIVKKQMFPERVPTLICQQLLSQLLCAPQPQFSQLLKALQESLPNQWHHRRVKIQAHRFPKSPRSQSRTKRLKRRKLKKQRKQTKAKKKPKQVKSPFDEIVSNVHESPDDTVKPEEKT